MRKKDKIMEWATGAMVVVSIVFLMWIMAQMKGGVAV